MHRYVSVVLLVGAAVFWLTRLDAGLAAFEPAIIIPLLQAQFILYATLSGGIFFQEFVTMGSHIVTHCLATARAHTLLTVTVACALCVVQVCHHGRRAGLRLRLRHCD